jgi:glycosyltransferase involved in cell wall biosynthesis
MSKADFYQAFRDGGDLYKGFKQLIQAVGVVQASGVDVRLEIVGDGDARPELEEWLKTRPEAAIVRLLGRVSDERLAQAYRENDVFCLPSEGEGFGLVFAEAMAQGMPCVCVGAGAAPEVVTNGVTGLVAAPRNVQDLAEKLGTLARDSGLRARLGAGARNRALEFFAYDKFLGRIDAALAELEKAPRS